jgi:hypothetical protein
MTVVPSFGVARPSSTRQLSPTMESEREAFARLEGVMTTGRSGALLALGLSLVLVSGCTSAVSPSPATAPPSPSDFSLEVMPPSLVGRTIGGQRVVFLVTATGSAADGPIQMAATADTATISIEPQPLTPGVVGEVTVVPEAVAEGSEPVAVQVTITGARAGMERTVERTLEVVSGTDELGGEAVDHLAPFAEWLAANRPELGIDPQTSWQSTPGSWVLVVNHYAFFSKDWELELSWHVMLPPDDWARIALRHRWTEARPSLAFEIASFSEGSEPHEIDPPADVWR